MFSLHSRAFPTSSWKTLSLSVLPSPECSPYQPINGIAVLLTLSWPRFCNCCTSLSGQKIRLRVTTAGWLAVWRVGTRIVNK